MGLKQNMKNMDYKLKHGSYNIKLHKVNRDTMEIEVNNNKFVVQDVKEIEKFVDETIEMIKLIYLDK